MADKTISELTAATTVQDDDLLVLEQDGVAKKLSGDTLGDYVYAAAAEKIAEVEQAVDDMSDEVDAIIEEATSTIGTLEEQQDTLIAAINSALEHQTDSTLSQSGWPADAAACGNLKSAIIFPVQTTFSWEQGNLNTGTGASTSTDKEKYIRTSSYIKSPYGFKFITSGDYRIRAYKYTTTSYSSYQGYTYYSGEVTIPDNKNYYKFVIYKYTEGAYQNIVPSENSNVAQYYLRVTDKTLSVPNMAADAAAVGDMKKLFMLESTNDTTDRTTEIQTLLQNYKFCALGSGVFCTSGITMPDRKSVV